MADRTEYDVIVVGGGAAGLFAAGQVAAYGARALLLEKMNHPGRKLEITGKGRCNLTNTTPLPEFIKHFGRNGQFLRPAFGEFFAQDLIRFLHSLGVQTVEERGGRVFPASGEAQEVVDCLITWMHDLGVKILNHAPVDRLLVKQGCITGVEIAPVAIRHGGTLVAQERPRSIYHARAVIIATGGASYPGTGSSGDGYRLAESVGHSIVAVRPALVPLETAGDVARRLKGLSLKNVTITLWINGKKHDEAFGEMLFTHFGLSGPIVLSLSRQAVDALRARHRVSLSIDLKPALDDDKLDERLLRDIDAHGKQQFSTLLKELMPRTLIPVCCDLTGIPAERMAHQITAQERKQLRRWLKHFAFDVTGYRSFKEAIITAGGVSTSEVDRHTLQSRLVAGLYFAGEVLDLDADTGGFNLQAAFSTGWLAGQSAAQQVVGRK